MAHARQQIRGAAATALTGLATTGSNVFKSRVHELAQDELDALRIYTRNEPDVETLQLTDPAEQRRDLELVVEGVTRATDDMDDTLDDIAEEVEVALAADITLGGLVHSVYIDSTEIEMSAEGDQPVGVVRMTFAVDYTVNSNAPGTLLT